jgi:hypothetical protein
MDYVIRFLAGGAVVSVFAILGDVLRPKSFAVCSAPPLRLRSPRLPWLSGSTVPVMWRLKAARWCSALWRLLLTAAWCANI